MTALEVMSTTRAISAVLLAAFAAFSCGVATHPTAGPAVVLEAPPTAAARPVA